MTRHDFSGFQPVKNRGATGAANWALTSSISVASGASAAAATQAAVTCTATENYDLSGTNSEGEVNALLRIIVNGHTTEHDFRRGGIANLSAATADEVARAINLNRDFVGKGIATLDSGNDQVTLTSREYGISSTIEVPDFGGNFNGSSGIFNFPTSQVEGTGDELEVTLTILDANGVAARGARVRIRGYDAASGGSLVASARFAVKSGAKVISGIATNDMVIEADSGCVLRVTSNAAEVHMHYDPDPGGAPAWINGVQADDQVRDFLAFA